MDRPGPETRIGNYLVRSRLAVGGMAEVYLATEARKAGSAREVVVKRMLPQLASDPAARRRFEDEGRFGMRIHHDNVVRVFDLSYDRGAPFIVLEYVRGCDLFHLLHRLRIEQTVLGRDLAIFIAVELAAGLVAVHEARDGRGEPLLIVHQDVSPSNILLSNFGDVKLSDLGIARATIRDSFGSTPTGERMKGKLVYLSPEQVRGAVIDQRSDVFAVGSVIAEMLLGKPLFGAANELNALLAIRDVELGPLRAIESSLTPGLPKVLYSALEKNPGRRIPTARELHEALSLFLPSTTAPLRRELGDLIARVAEATRSDYPDATPLREIALDGSIAPESETRVTVEFEPHIYSFVDASGGGEVAMTYAEAVEKISTGTLRPAGAVRVDGSPPKPISSVGELARHLPASNARSLAMSSESFLFERRGFLSAFIGFLIARRTGLFVCERASERKELAVEEGQLRFVGSNVAGEMLGEFLVARSVVSRGELDMALAMLPRFDGHLGDTLIGLGLVDPVRLFREVETQVRERAIDVFLWEDGIARFVPGPTAKEAAFPPERDAFALVDEALRRRQSRSMDVRASARPPALRVGLARQGPDGLETAPLDKPERLLLQRLRHPGRLMDVLGDLTRDLGGDAPRAERAFTLLELAGALEFTA